MNYYFTGILLYYLFSVMFYEPAYPRNDILIMVLILVALVILAYQSNRGNTSLGTDTIILTIIIIALAMIGHYV